MNKQISAAFSFLLVASFNTLTAEDAVEADRPVVEVHVSDGLFDGEQDGRMYVLFSENQGREPRRGPSWFGPEPFYGVDLKGVKAGSKYIIDDQCDGFPDVISKLPEGTYAVQAVFDYDFYNSNHNDGVGNVYSNTAVVHWKPAESGSNHLVLMLENKIQQRPFRASQFARQVRVYSPRLSAFHNREVIQKAGVILPESYDDNPQKRYPVIYSVTGFGGKHESVEGAMPPEVDAGEVEFIRVILDGQCKWGHHTYANSAKNGPRGDAFVYEMVPEIDKRFRTIAQPTARFLTGHSSGGWSSLWLQVNYPKHFGGTWSTGPDVVDFRDYQEVNLYHDPPLSLYTKPNGDDRPLARQNGRILIWYKDFGKMDDCIGRGGQLRSFEAVFSPLDEYGSPIQMWTRDTGTVIPQTVKYWVEYDINRLIERRWETTQGDLRGKINVFMGTLAELDPSAVIELIEGRDHFNLLTGPLRARIREEMTAAYKKYHD